MCTVGQYRGQVAKGGLSSSLRGCGTSGTGLSLLLGVVMGASTLLTVRVVGHRDDAVPAHYRSSSHIVI